jgi:hypothetical protein
MMAASIELKEEKAITIEHAISHVHLFSFCFIIYPSLSFPLPFNYLRLLCPQGYLVWADMGSSSFSEDEVARIKERMFKIIDAFVSVAF